MKDKLISSLTLDGRTQLLESSERLGISLEQYIDTLLYVDKTDSYWIDENFVKENKEKKLKYQQNKLW